MAAKKKKRQGLLEVERDELHRDAEVRLVEVVGDLEKHGERASITRET